MKPSSSPKLDQELSSKFEHGLEKLCSDIKDKAGYPPNYLVRLLSRKSGIDVAIDFIRKPKPSVGFLRLLQENHLELTIEAFVLDNPQWHPLFPKEILAKAEKRLLDHDYTPKAKIAD